MAAFLRKTLEMTDDFVWQMEILCDNLAGRHVQLTDSVCVQFDIKI